MGNIYKITNQTNGMIYIGQTVNDIHTRFAEHCKKSSNCRYLKHAIEKYGKDTFKIELLCRCPDEELDKLEKEYIDKHNSLVPNGYNLKDGGNSSRHNEETKKKISESLLLNTDRVNARAQLGKPHTEQEKIKISEGVKKTLNGSLPKGWAAVQEYSKTKWIPIIQLDSNRNYLERYEHSVQIANKLNSNKSSIHNACKKGIIHKGFYFTYEKDYLASQTQ